jgi:hypothetical protein
VLGFPGYKRKIECFIETYGFRRPLRLDENPSRQDAWSTWLEYLCFEQREFERQVRQNAPKGKACRDAWTGLAASVGMDEGLNRLWPPEEQAVIQDSLRSARAAMSERDASELRLSDQRHRVQWALAEARVMEAELSRPDPATKAKGEGKAGAKGGAKAKAKPKAAAGKRKRADDGDDGQPPPRKAKTGKGGKAVAPAAPAAPTAAAGAGNQARRSRRVAGLAPDGGMIPY